MESFMMIKYVWEVRVLVLYMGGIIGMKKIDGGEYNLCEDFDWCFIWFVFYELNSWLEIKLFMIDVLNYVLINRILIENWFFLDVN